MTNQEPIKEYCVHCGEEYPSPFPCEKGKKHARIINGHSGTNTNTASKKECANCKEVPIGTANSWCSYLCDCSCHKKECKPNCNSNQWATGVCNCQPIDNQGDKYPIFPDNYDADNFKITYQSPEKVSSLEQKLTNEVSTGYFEQVGENRKLEDWEIEFLEKCKDWDIFAKSVYVDPIKFEILAFVKSQKEKSYDEGVIDGKDGMEDTNEVVYQSTVAHCIGVLMKKFDDLERNDPDKSTKNWMNYKFIRNIIRDTLNKEI